MQETKAIRCTNCGASLDTATAENGVISCPYCLTTTQLPSLNSSDKVVSALAAGETSLRAGDFEKAMSDFTLASEENPEEPMAYWGKALARFKVQYIKDHAYNRYQPILFREEGRSFLEDRDYLKAVKLANYFQAEDYKKKAEEIEHVREEFNRLSQEGIDYDAFICVKVTGEYGLETEDSKAADAVWRLLSDKGFRPFLSERDVRNRRGADYEAMILYALRKAKTMIIVCFDEAYLETPWVKNEYTRYLKMIEDGDKDPDSLTIVYDKTPIDRLPGRSGRIQGIDYALRSADLAIADFVGNHQDQMAHQAVSKAQVGEASSQARNLVIRGEQEFERGDLKKAKSYFDEALNEDPTRFEAWYDSFFLLSSSLPYLGLKLHGCGSTYGECLKADKHNEEIMATFESHPFKMARRYGSEKQKAVCDALLHSTREKKQKIDFEMAASLLPLLEQALNDNEDPRLIDELAAFIKKLDPGCYEVKLIVFYRVCQAKNLAEALFVINENKSLADYLYKQGDFPSLLQNVPERYRKTCFDLSFAMKEALSAQKAVLEKSLGKMEVYLYNLPSLEARFEADAKEGNKIFKNRKRPKERGNGFLKFLVYFLTSGILPIGVVFLGTFINIYDPNATGNTVSTAFQANWIPIFLVAIITGIVASFAATRILRKACRKRLFKTYMHYEGPRFLVYGKCANERKQAAEAIADAVKGDLKEKKRSLRALMEAIGKIEEAGF